MKEIDVNLNNVLRKLAIKNVICKFENWENLMCISVEEFIIGCKSINIPLSFQEKKTLLFLNID